MIDLRRIEPPFVLRLNRELERCRAAHIGRLRELGLVQGVTSEYIYSIVDCPLFTALCLPFARGEALDLLTDLAAWSVALDEALTARMNAPSSAGSPAQTLASCRQVLQWHSIESHEDRIVSSLCKIVHGLKSLKWINFDRPCRRLDQLFHGLEQAFEQKASGEILSFAECRRLRRAASGFMFALDAAAAVGHFQICQEAYDHELVERLRSDTREVTTLTQDVISSVNMGEHHAVGNLVDTLCREHDYSTSESEALLCAMIQSRIENFRSTEKVLKESSFYASMRHMELDRLDRYIDAMKTLMRGSYELYLRTRRPVVSREYREGMSRIADHEFGNGH